jgi:predicted 3-demethylubiquinone-9 3-methyltransferase (glyoxalase superfamily)
MRKITPFLWYNGQIKEAVDLYTAVFPNSKVINTSPGPGGALMSATLEIEGQQVILFNGGPSHELSPAASLYVNCESQEEVDRLWAQLVEGGAESRCGWLIDRFGLSWQIIPSVLPKLLQDPDREKAKRAMNAMLGMAKIDIAALEKAAAGN